MTGTVFGRPPVAVKICGLTDVAAVAAAVEYGADAIGVVLAPGGPRTVGLEQASALLADVPAGVARVGVFVDPAPADVAAAVATCGLTHVQVHAVAGSVGELRVAAGVPVIVGLRMEGPHSVAPARASDGDLVLVDAAVPGQHGGTGRTFDWAMLEREPLGRPYVLAGGLTPANVADAVRRVRPGAVDVSSGVESSPGRKDIGLIRRFIEAVRAVEQEG